MLDLHDHLQTVPTVPSFLLATLLAHPDIQDGLRAGVQTFQEKMFDEDHEKAWNEQDIIQFVNEELSSKTYRWEQKVDQMLGGPPLSYLHHLGFVLSYLDQALTATQSRQDQSEERSVSC